MRVTQQSLLNMAVRHLQQTQESVQHTRMQIASTRRMLSPDDDPQGTQQILNLRRHLDGVQTSLRNLDFTRGWMDATTLGQDEIIKVLTSARVQGLQGASETNAAEERRSIATTVRQAFRQAVDIANTRHRDQYIFGGYRVDQLPFVADYDALTVAYQGDGGGIVHELEPGTRAQINVPGNDPMFPAAFDALAQLVQALEADDTAGIRAAVDSLDDAADLALMRQSEMGSRVRLVEGTRDRLQRFEVDLESLLSKVEDVDMPEAILRLNSFEVGYETTLQVMAKAPGRSLFDYLA